MPDGTLKIRLLRGGKRIQVLENPVVTPGIPGLTIWTLNTCTLKSQDIIPLAQSFADSTEWDILCIQEGTTTLGSGVHTEAGLWIVTGLESQTGAPQLLLSSRLGARLRRTKLHKNYVIAEVGLQPPLITFSLYLPPHANHSESSFEDTMEHFRQDLQIMQKAAPGSFTLGGGDCNLQPHPLKGPWLGNMGAPLTDGLTRTNRIPSLGLLARLRLETANNFPQHRTYKTSMARTRKSATQQNRLHFCRSTPHNQNPHKSHPNTCDIN